MESLKKILYVLTIILFISTGTASLVANAQPENRIVSNYPEEGVEYGNILITWESSAEASLTVRIRMGGALIAMMEFTPYTLQHTMNYSNPPQAASGTFIVEFNALAKGGKLYCKGFQWKTLDNENSVTSLIGTWQIAEQ